MNKWPIWGTLAVAVLFALMLMLALSGCMALGKIHALDMSDRWCSAHPSAPAWRNCWTRDPACNPNVPPHCDPWKH